MSDAELLQVWHPLDHTPPPDYVPPSWDCPHVGKRLVEALQTLRHVPVHNGPRAPGNAWPGYTYEWQDLLAQQESDPLQQQRDAQDKNRTRIVPSSSEIQRMEAAIAWPGRYLTDVPQFLLVVQTAAFGRSRDRDLHWVSRRLDLPGRLVRRWNREGLDTIAAGLRRDGVRIF